MPIGLSFDKFSAHIIRLNNHNNKYSKRKNILACLDQAVSDNCLRKCHMNFYKLVPIEVCFQRVHMVRGRRTVMTTQKYIAPYKNSNFAKLFFRLWWKTVIILFPP